MQIKKKQIKMALFFLLAIAIVVIAFLCGRHTLTRYVEKLEAEGREKQEVIVAVIDSGCNELEQYRERLLEGYDLYEEDYTVQDIYGHGTAVCSLVLSNTPDTVKVLPLKVTDEEGEAAVADVAEAIRYAAEQNADIINLSMNGVMTGTGKELQETIKEADEKGILVIVSAGNDGEDVKHLVPANVEEAVVVAAVDENRTPYFFSGYGESVDFCTYGKFNGETATSYSAAYLTSMAAVLQTYGEEQPEKVLNRYRERYKGWNFGRKESYGAGYVWLDMFLTDNRSEEEKDMDASLTAYREKGVYDLGLSILDWEWKELDSEEMDRYLGSTGKEYVGMFLEQLSEEDRELLEEKSNVLHTDVTVSHFRLKEGSSKYETTDSEVHDFTKYCVDRYREKSQKMSLSGWAIDNDSIEFYISNAQRTITYRYVLEGLIRGTGASGEDPFGNLVSTELMREVTATVNVIGDPDDSFPEPRIDLDNPITQYLTAVTSRHVEYKDLATDGELYYAWEEDTTRNTLNGADNGIEFFGISISFSEMKLEDRTGYHYDSNQVLAYNYNNRTEPAYSYNYAELTSGEQGFVFHNTPVSTSSLSGDFHLLTPALKYRSFTAIRDYWEEAVGRAETDIEEYAYNWNPRYMLNAAGELDESEIAKHYKIKLSEDDVYRVSGESSFDTVNGSMTLNTGIYGISSLTFRETDREGQPIAIKNDTAEYVIAPVPNTYNITLDANWGQFTDYRTGEPVTVTGVTTTYDSTDYNNIAWATPTRDGGYVFKGWYVDPDDPDNSEGRDVARNGGVQVWDANGKAKWGTYWNDDGEDALWCYTGNDHPVFFAHWERDNTTNVCVDANWGHLFDYEDTHSHTMSWTNITSFTTRVGKNYFDDIRKLAPYRDDGDFTFQGWYVDPNDPDNSEGRDIGRNGGVQVWKPDGTANLENGNGFWDENGNWEYSGDSVVVFAHWKDNSMPETYTAYFDANGGSLYDYYWTNTWKDTFYCWTEVGKNYFDNVSALNPAWKGHTFLGWYDHASAGTKVYNASGAVTNEGTYFSNNLWQKHGDAYFFAHWKTNTYKVIYHSNNGTRREVVQDCVYGTGYDYLGKIFSMPGKTMSFWNTKADGTGESRTPGAAFGENLAEEDGAVIHLYAQWDTNTYNVRFDANGGTGSRPAMTGLSYGTTYTLSANNPPSNGFTRTGYAFQGWNTKTDGTGENIGDGGNIRDLSEVNGGTVTLYARWKDVAPPEIEIETGNPENASGRLVYGWTNRNIVLKFKATDNGSGMDSLTLYEEEGTGGTVLRSAKDTVEYTVSKEGGFYYTLVAKDMAGNTATLYITTKIDYGTPTGEMNVSYDGQHLDVSIDNIVEENRTNPGNQASGCKEAWVILTGLDGEGNTLCEEQLPLVLQTPGNIYTGAAYSGGIDLNDTFNYDSDFIQITAYVRDYAGNYLPPIESEVIPAFTLSGHVERCLGAAQSWRRGEAGKVYVSTGTFVDSLKIEYPAEWTALDETLKERIYDYGANMEPEKNEADLFYIPLYAEDGQYIIVVHAYKNGREKTVELPVRSSGSMLEEIRTRLR